MQDPRKKRRDYRSERNQPKCFDLTTQFPVAYFFHWREHKSSDCTSQMPSSTCLISSETMALLLLLTVPSLLLTSVQGVPAQVSKDVKLAASAAVTQSYVGITPSSTAKAEINNSLSVSSIVTKDKAAADPKSGKPGMHTDVVKRSALQEEVAPSGLGHRQKRQFNDEDRSGDLSREELGENSESNDAKASFELMLNGVSGSGEKFDAKRHFDSIGESGLSGIHQNYMGRRNNIDISSLLRNRLSKRQFDSIGESSLSGIHQNFIGRRNFDSIGESSLSGLYQNHMGKRQFDMISESELTGIHQNYLEPRRNNRNNRWQYSPKRNFDFVGRGGMSGMYKKFIGKRDERLFDGKRPFDSIGESGLSGIHQNYLGRRSFDSIGASGLSGMNQNFYGKRSFDSIGSSGLSGIHQNYLGKRSFDSIGESGLSGINQNFYGKRNFDSIGESALSGLGQNYYGKRNFDSIGESALSGLGQNFYGKRNFDSIGESALSGLGQNFYGKRNFDSIGESALTGLGQNYYGKRNFDSIGESALSGLNQNYYGKRSVGHNRMSDFVQNIQHSISLPKRFLDRISESPLSGLNQNFLKKKEFKRSAEQVKGHSDSSSPNGRYNKSTEESTIMDGQDYLLPGTGDDKEHGMGAKIVLRKRSLDALDDDGVIYGLPVRHYIPSLQQHLHNLPFESVFVGSNELQYEDPSSSQMNPLLEEADDDSVETNKDAGDNKANDEQQGNSAGPAQEASRKKRAESDH